MLPIRLLTPTLTASRSRVSTKSSDPSAERLPLPACHFALANLVYDFAGLHLALSVFRNGLSLGQKTKHPPCDLRFHPERLGGGYDSIPSEYRAVPGNSRVRIQTLAGLIRQHQEIGFRSIHPVVKLFVVSGNTMIHLPDR